MQTLKNLLVTLHSDEDGAGATEYIILLILIACVVIAMVKVFGETISTKFSESSAKVTKDVVWDGSGGAAGGGAAGGGAAGGGTP